ASGTREPLADETPIVATARPTYTAVTTAKASAIARGRSWPGRRNSPASCATASQPTNSQTRMLAAVPTATQPCGANGCQLSPARDGSATEIASASTAISVAARTSWTPDETRRPNQFASSTEPNIASPTEAATAVPEPVRSA